jgi:predicted nucleotidyltransferase component of viral defense system
MAGSRRWRAWRKPSTAGWPGCGPVSSSHGLPRIKLDLTADERVVLPPVKTQIFHPYSDGPEVGIYVLAYDYVEAFAEKFRALAERTRPRDLYGPSMMVP